MPRQVSPTECVSPASGSRVQLAPPPFQPTRRGSGEVYFSETVKDECGYMSVQFVGHREHETRSVLTCYKPTTFP